MTKSIPSDICFNNYYLQKFYLNENLNLYYHAFSEKFPNQCKEQSAKCPLTSPIIQGLILNMVVKLPPRFWNNGLVSSRASLTSWEEGASLAVFLTHVGIQQMPTWLPTWKAKSLYHVGTFLPTWFFLPLQKFKTIKTKLEKNTYTQANTCLLHISRNFKDIFKYICFTRYL